MSRARNTTLITLGAFALVAAGCTAEQANDATEAETAVADNAAAAAPAAPAAGGHSGAVEGVVSDSSGQPLAGAFVKLINAERRLTFMVVSQDGGRYTAEKLPPGNYVVQAIGGDNQSAWSPPVTVTDQAAARLNVALNQNRAADLPAAWPRRVGEDQARLDSLPDGPGKDLIATRCVACHDASRVVASRYERSGWESTLEEMRQNIVGIGLADLTDGEAGVLLDYLAVNMPPMPPPDANSRFPRALMHGEARNYRVVQYDLENLGAEVHDVAVDPWGVGWGNQRTGGKISRFDPVTYEYSEVGPPLHSADRARPGNLQISRDGIMWLPDPFESRWVSYDIAADKWTDWAFPTDKIRGPVQGNSMVLADDGSVWSSGPGAARRLDPATGEWNAWDTPTWTNTQVNPGGYGITVDGAGRAWVAENLVDRLARFDAKTGEVVEFEIPVEGTSYPRRMDHDPEGNVWVGLWGSGNILKIDYKTDEMTVIEPPIANSGAYSIDFDETNNLMWVTLHTVDIIARYNPRTEEWLMLPMPQAETDVRRIEVDQNNPNRVWWQTVAYNARIGYLELLEE